MNSIVKVILLISTLVAGATMAFAIESNDITHIPILDVRLTVPDNFDPNDPVVVFTYSNTSPYNAIFKMYPGNDFENMIMTPPPTFDGKDADYIDESIQDIIPKNGKYIEPLNKLEITNRLSWAYIIPTNWKTMFIYDADELSTNARQYTISRNGSIILINTIALKSYDDLKKIILSNPRVKKALIDDTRRHSGSNHLNQYFGQTNNQFKENGISEIAKDNSNSVNIRTNAGIQKDSFIKHDICKWLYVTLGIFAVLLIAIFIRMRKRSN